MTSDNFTIHVMPKDFEESTWVYNFGKIPNLNNPLYQKTLSKLHMSPKNYRYETNKFDEDTTECFIISYIPDGLTEVDRVYKTFYIFMSHLNIDSGVSKYIYNPTSLANKMNHDLEVYLKNLGFQMKSVFPDTHTYTTMEITWDIDLEIFCFDNDHPTMDIDIEFKNDFNRLLGFKDKNYKLGKAGIPSSIVNETDPLIYSFNYFFMIQGSESKNVKYFYDLNGARQEINYTFSVGVDESFKNIIEYIVDESFELNQEDLFITVWNSWGEKVKFFRNPELTITFDKK